MIRNRDEVDRGEANGHPRAARIVLVRDVRNDADGGSLIRTWAYIEDDKLPRDFADSMGEEQSKVPEKYRAEFDRDYYPEEIGEALRCQGLMGHTFTILRLRDETTRPRGNGWESGGEASDLENAKAIAWGTTGVTPDHRSQVYQKVDRHYRLVWDTCSRVNHRKCLEGGNWEERAGGDLHCLICGKQIGGFRQ